MLCQVRIVGVCLLASVLLAGTANADVIQDIVIRSPLPSETPITPDKMIEHHSRQPQAVPVIQSPARVAKPTVAAPTAVLDLEDVVQDPWLSTGRYVLRSEPSVTALIVDAILPGERVQAAGKVKGTVWFALDRKGKLLFFRVFVGPGPALAPALEPHPAPSAPGENNQPALTNVEVDNICPVLIPPQDAAPE